MSEVTRMLDSMAKGDPKAAEELLPLVYDELRKLAAHKMASEAPGHTLQATALVHEAWLRIEGSDPKAWEGRRHFFAAAAEAMRRILVESARRKQRLRHGGRQQRVELDQSGIAAPVNDDKLLLVSEALDALEAEDPLQAQVVIWGESALGACLLGQKKYAEAEPLLEAGYQGLKQRYNKYTVYYKARDLRMALSRLIQLCEETAQSAKAAQLKQELADFEKREGGPPPGPGAPP